MTNKLAKNTIIVRIQASDPAEYAIFNPISGSFDLMSDKEYQLIMGPESLVKTAPELATYLLERGYSYPNAEAEQKAVSQAYYQFQQEIGASQVQLMLVPTYGCNLACTYCFQHGVEQKSPLITRDTVDAFFRYARENFSNGPLPPFITLFGGEPLVNSPAQHDIINYILDKCAEHHYELSIVTNGFDLIHYVDDLKKVKIKEIQITLDGSPKIHDSRRSTANKKGTFDTILTGMQAAVAAGFPINLRSVVDLENIQDLVNLATIMDQNGWLDLPEEKFKTQLGRNYELFECYAKPQHLMTQVELWGQFATLAQQYPVLKKFHKPDFKGIRYIAETGEMYLASFDTCPACKTEWVFDLNGEIYGCTASCGRQEYLLGKFWPEVKLNDQAITQWQTRNVVNIKECQDCKYDVICGGGCGVVSANQHQGRVHSPDCRPIKELLDIGVNYYLDDIRKLEDPTPTVTTPATGCVICQKPLHYQEQATAMTCHICGKTFSATAQCEQGHYVCDTCHNGDVLTLMEQHLVHSGQTNPVALAMEIFELPNLKMHGPEYHSLVPGVLVSAWLNKTGQTDTKAISEAIRRGKQILGGSCGTHGNCGAGVGTGIASSIINRATPLTGKSRSNANLMTAQALMDISKTEAARCCKREAITAITSFVQHHPDFSELSEEQTKSYTCVQYKQNRECAGIKCDYFPKHSS